VTLEEAVRAHFPVKYAARAKIVDPQLNENVIVWLTIDEDEGTLSWTHIEQWRKLFALPDHIRRIAAKTARPFRYAEARTKFEIVEVPTMPLMIASALAAQGKETQP
jgi:hypothetical protein